MPHFQLMLQVAGRVALKGFGSLEAFETAREAKTGGKTGKTMTEWHKKKRKTYEKHGRPFLVWHWRKTTPKGTIATTIDPTTWRYQWFCTFVHFFGIPVVAWHEFTVAGRCPATFPMS